MSSDISICIQIALVIASVNVQAVNNVNEVNTIAVSCRVKPNCVPLPPTPSEQLHFFQIFYLIFLVHVAVNRCEFSSEYMSVI